MHTWPWLVLVSTIASAAIATPDPHPHPHPHPASLAGLYDGGQMEIAAGLELSRNGQFRYAFSYGALDEAAAGTWEVRGGNIVLTVQQYESNDPNGSGTFGNSVLSIEQGALTLPRYDRMLRFRKR